MKQLVSLNKSAIVFIAFLTTPIGLLCVIGIAAVVETAGIALFFSGLFIEKARQYIQAAGFSASLQNPAIFSIAIGAILSLVIMLGVLVLKLIGKDRLSKTISIAFALLAIVTYYNVLIVSGFEIMRFLGVVLMVAVPSLIVAVVSSHLADLILASDTFRQMKSDIWHKAAKSDTRSRFEPHVFETKLN